MANVNYTVLATSQEDDRTIPNTNGQGRPIGSSGRGYTVLAKGDDIQSGELQSYNSKSDEVSLGDVIQDTLHIAGSKNDDGTRDFFGGSDANERLGLGIQNASGFNNPTENKPTTRDFIRQDGNVTVMSDPRRNPKWEQEVTGNVIGEVGKGISDTATALPIGAGGLVADIVNLVDTDNAFADYMRDTVSEYYKQKQYYPDGAASAVGEEVGGVAVTAPLGGKAADMLLGGAKIAKGAIREGINKRGSAGVQAAQEDANIVAQRFMKQGDQSIPPSQRPGVTEAVKATEKFANVPKTPQLSLITDLVGKVSPATKKFIETNYEAILGVFGNTKASMNIFKKRYADLEAKGFDDIYIRNELLNSYRPLKTAKEALFSPPGKYTGKVTGLDMDIPATGKLFGKTFPATATSGSIGALLNTDKEKKKKKDN